MTLHTVLELDSVITTRTGVCNGAGEIVTYIFDFKTNEIIMVDCNNTILRSNIVKVFPTNSVLNIDAEIEDRYYNFFVAENYNDNMSLVIQNFKRNEGKSTGLFSNDAKVKYSVN